MKNYKQHLPGIALIWIMLFALSCNDDDDKPKVVPEVITSAISNITTTTATGGGEIVSDGNDAITASGVVYSSTNNTPTLSDSKTEEDATEGSFTTELEGLTSGKQYYVRAYATNSVGTGYGEVVTFSTGNAGPTATNLAISGTVQVPETLTFVYTFSDVEGDAESGTVVQWYRANDVAGAGETAISGATQLTYELQVADEFKFIRAGVTPKAATGSLAGTEVKSGFVGPVAEEPTTLTFPYNGASVTYGIVVSATTGRRWLDRNLGSPNTPTAFNDWANAGDLFQWGRGADGHQLITRAATGGATVGAATTTTLSTTNSPVDSKFIMNSSSPFDWRDPQNDNLWQGVDGFNNPCPTGWRIPTKAEWEAENITSTADGYTKLKLTVGGGRYEDSGNFVFVASQGWYWSSTISENSIFPGSTTWSYGMIYAASSASGDGFARGSGRSCRCIKD